MRFAFISELFSGHAATAICWTLIHSLWQGLFFVISTAVILLVTKRVSPAARYRVLSVQFLLFTPITVCTFIWQWNSSIPGSSLLNDNNVNSMLLTYGDHFQGIDTGIKYKYLDSIAAFLSDHAATIVAAWFIIFLVKSIKITSSLLYTQHLRSHKTHLPSSGWMQRIETLCQQLHIKKTVQLIESEIIKVPAVFGHLKPVIFIPLGMLTGLQAQQVEAVLLHELAHIRRNDYLFNLLQNIIETVFFFNPALLWMSAVLREEREHCCDDIAIAQMKNRKQFIESLIRFRELCIYNRSSYVTAFPGTGNSFVNRIKRIAMNKNKSLNPAGHIFLAFSLVSVGILVTAFCQVKEPPPITPVQTAHIVEPLPGTPVLPVHIVAAPAIPVPEKIAAVPEIITPVAPVDDTVPASKSNRQPAEAIAQLDRGEYSVTYSDIDKAAARETVVLKTAGNEYKIVRLNGELAYLMVNDEKIPKDKMGEYSDLLKKINDHLEKMKKEQQKRDAEQLIRNEEQKKRNAEQAVRNQEQDKRNAEQAVRNEEQKKRDAEQAVRNEEQKKRNDEQAGRTEKRNADQEIRNDEQKKRNAEQARRNEEQLKRNAEQEVRNEEQKKRNAEQAIRNEEQLKRNAEQEVRNKEQAIRNAETVKLIDDLVTDKIITDKNAPLSFSLTNDAFIVNGVTQPREIFAKYKTRYVILLGGTYNFKRD